MAVRVLTFAGSTRSDSFNKRVARVAADGARAAGAEVTLLDLRDFPLPLYDGDLEVASGLPEKAIELKAIFASHQGLLIAAPEYNGSLPAVLKNTIDWVSRSAPGEKPMQSWRGKTAALMSASPSRVGGLRGLQHLRHVLMTIGVLVIPEHRTIGAAHQAFDEEGRFRDPSDADGIRKVAARLVEVTGRMS